LGQLSESQLKDGANPFDAFKMLGEVFEVGFIFFVKSFKLTSLFIDSSD
jgi:hypothetical protein